MLTVVETQLFQRQWPMYWTEEERGAFAAYVAEHPTAGDVVIDSERAFEDTFQCMRQRRMSNVMEKRGRPSNAEKAASATGKSEAPAKPAVKKSAAKKTAKPKQKIARKSAAKGAV